MDKYRHAHEYERKKQYNSKIAYYVGKNPWILASYSFLGLLHKKRPHVEQCLLTLYFVIQITFKYQYRFGKSSKLAIQRT